MHTVKIKAYLIFVSYVKDALILKIKVFQPEIFFFCYYRVMLKTANVIILTPDGKVILQLRDDKPGISCPGQITAFGGSCEKNEEPLQAAKREMKEELGLDLQDKDLTFWKAYRKTVMEHGEDSLVNLFILNYPLQAKEITVFEGQGYFLVSPDDDFNSINFTPAARHFISDFFKEFPVHG